MIKVYYANELYHHGMKGQKWGIRKYQNPDGSLTAEGKARRAAMQQKAKAKAAKKKEKQAKRDERIGKLKAKVSDLKARQEAREKAKRENTKVVREKDMSKYTTKELQEKTARLRAENDYMNAVNLNNKLNPVKVSLGKRVWNSLKEQTVSAVSEYAKDAYKSWVKDQLKTMVGNAMNSDKQTQQQPKQQTQPKQQNQSKISLDGLKPGESLYEYSQRNSTYNLAKDRASTNNDSGNKETKKTKKTKKKEATAFNKMLHEKIDKYIK